MSEQQTEVPPGLREFRVVYPTQQGRFHPGNPRLRGWFTVFAPDEVTARAALFQRVEPISVLLCGKRNGKGIAIHSGPFHDLRWSTVFILGERGRLVVTEPVVPAAGELVADTLSVNIFAEV